jgi:hypothetical protein
MQFRIFAEQHFMSESLERIAHTLMSQSRVYIRKLESR